MFKLEILFRDIQWRNSFHKNLRDSAYERKKKIRSLQTERVIIYSLEASHEYAMNTMVEISS